MNIKHILLLAMLAFGLAAPAQTYVGSMTTDGYTRRDVTARLQRQGDRATILIFNTKFARMMPVKVDVEIPEVVVDSTALRCRQVVPTSNGKPYPKYTVRNLRGTADGRSLRFSCTMGDKQVTYTGSLTQKQ